MLDTVPRSTAQPQHAPVEVTSPTRSHRVEAPAAADRLLAILLEIETMTLVQTMTLRAGLAEITLIGGFGKLLEVVDARLPGVGWEYETPRHSRQVAHLICALVRQPGAIEITVQRGAAAWSRKGQGWAVGEIRGLCRRLLAAQDAAGLAVPTGQDEPTRADGDAGSAGDGASDDFVEAVAAYCRAALKVRSDGTSARAWGDGDLLAQRSSQLTRDMARWRQATSGVLLSSQFILLRPEADGTCVSLLIESAQATIFVFDGSRTGVVSTVVSRYLSGVLG
jgi:hypothetical protein